VPHTGGQRGRRATDVILIGKIDSGLDAFASTDGPLKVTIEQMD
jgi:hypothetical protein